MSEPIYELMVCRIGGRTRCVYANNFRIVGSKPYVSEKQDCESFKFTLDDLRSAFPDLTITPTEIEKA